jgi:hypothetical protein
MPKRGVLAFGEYGGVASTTCNNLIAYLLFLRKCHAPAQSLLRLGPRSWVFASAFLKSKLANTAVCPGRTAFGHLRHGTRHGAWHSGAPGVLRRGVGAPLGGLFIYFLGEIQFFFEGNAITFLIPRSTPRAFFAILTTHRRNFF